MQMPSSRLPRFAPSIPALALLAAALAGCTVGSSAPRDGGPLTDAGPARPLEARIAPAEIALESVDGSTPSVTFDVSVRDALGDPVAVDRTRWVLTDERLGSVDPSGTFTATGRAGGTVEVLAMVESGGETLIAEARVTVRVELAVDAPPELVARFEGTPEVEDPFEAVTLLYPLDGAHMPNNVGPPDLQWHPVDAPGDTYRIVMETPHATVRSYVAHDGPGFGSHHAVDPRAFRALADSARSAEVTLRVDRLPAGGDRVILGHPVTIFLSEDGLYGTLYYWQVRAAPAQSDVFRIDAATSARESVFDVEGSTTCVGCHTLSQDGRRLAATLGGDGGWRSTVVDAASGTTPPAELLGPLVPAYHAIAWSPDGDRALASRPLAGDRDDTRLFLLDGADGRELEATGLPTAPAGSPTWSPDGARVAWMEGGGDGPSGTEAATRIVIADVARDAFTPRVLHEGAALADSPEGGVTDSHPTFSPDSRYVVFAHGTSSVSTTDGVEAAPRSGLYLVSVEGGEPIRLDEGMGPEGPVDAFWPVFSPFVTVEADGRLLYWLAFYSRQAFGNDRVGTGGTRRRQLWLTAIDPARAEAGADPSHPPYWLPGQDRTADDIAALWAPTACRGRGEGCAASSECCSGECAAADPAAPDVLTCRPPRTCRTAGQSCETEDDCCSGLGCNLNVCGYAPPE